VPTTSESVLSSSASTTDPGLRARLADGEAVVGTFLSLGSPVAAEICALAGFDWVLVDLEHGSGSEAEMLPQLQAVARTGAAGLVRVEANERPRFARALDSGAEGIMVPRVETAEEARLAASYLRYPPEGVRGVASMHRGSEFGRVRGPEALETLNERVLGVIQVESETSVANAGEIAAVDGVDVLFVGPSDLSHSMGIFGQTDDPRFQEALDRVVDAATGAGKASGILARNEEELDRYRDRGFRFLGIGSDSAFLSVAARAAGATRARASAS
jgi:2-keto-3-deoxy-L-rhamnonate aldolase RhmA